ncbi:Response regulator receiver domain-containing protein [Maribacter orientalis]|uniref:Response regulator receiver domain-containing protein n=1 Tax=Maribacter orientalis TaxID=228957 RepID=A0A1H7WXN2_9FLAO|nr:response regulator [Maribacter orientalis]SEM26362.1 Response regulator receiver domain-containing protein [Maribacter orientalis]|tara:strand:+ start:2442 stop:2846 length:405 start_codon:yes stop_codon:yes gene_type:complete
MTKISDITIIDDDAIMVFGLRKLISCTVDCNSIISYGNGLLAYDGIKKKLEQKAPIPQIIFLDINMPIMDGWEFLEAFIKLPISDKIRINIVTSSIDPFDKQQWEFYKNKSHHLITFNQKPIDRNTIEEITKIL